jgi:hypothetical protein
VFSTGYNVISMLAGTDESPGQTLIKNGKKVKIIRGMAGYGATMSKNERETKVEKDVFDLVPEGKRRDPIGDCIRDPCFFCSPRSAWTTEETWISNTISTLYCLCTNSTKVWKLSCLTEEKWKE